MNRREQGLDIERMCECGASLDGIRIACPACGRKHRIEFVSTIERYRSPNPLRTSADTLAEKVKKVRRASLIEENVVVPLRFK